ncbi:MAG: hypothetical protein NTZ90_00900 [Proteobacteria bacterium]|nr:hypothetical protein [Pseudomonadota bacterium]
MHKFSPRSITTPEFDYNLLMSMLSPYRQPWSKIRQLLRQGSIVRVKKGIYVKDPGDGGPHSEAILANMIYGPSYVSGESALSWYGMIPERVEQIMSVTTKPSKTFTTPVGTFIYKRLARERYATGFVRVALDDQRGFLIASREKALVDTIADKDIAGAAELREYLTESLRIDEGDLRKLSPARLRELKIRFRKPIVTALATLVEELKS